MRAWTWGIVALLSAASSVALVGDARAMCGCMVGRRPPPASPTEQGALLNKATVVVMLREGTHTVLSFQNDYFGPAEDFALVVPVPVVLTDDDVTTLDRGLFDRLQAVAAPHMVELFEQDPCPRPRASTRGIDAIAGSALGGSGRGGEAIEGAPPPAVVVEAQFQEGEYDITILGANDSSALERWLTDAGYRLPSGAERHLRPYVQAGMKFFVARVDIGRLREVARRRQAQLARSRAWMQTGGLGQLIEGPAVERASDPTLGRFLSPLRIHYESEEFSLPVRLGLLNSIGEQDLVVHILSPEGRYELANYGNRWVPTNVHVNGRAARDFGRFYDAFFGALSGRAPRRVWTEYAGPLTSVADAATQQLLGPASGLLPCVGCGRAGLAQADLDALGEAVVHQGASRLTDYTLTRLHYRYGQRGLPNDLVFRPGRPMAGGIEDATGRRLGRAARPATRNEFRVRFIAQHAWAGPLTCASPRRGQWGGRQADGTYRETELTAWPADRPVPLGAWIRDSVPQLGVARRR
ncbi:MAG: DUF2330 domain-containing protein [Sandaracinaceae bacterium]|nr:DUF2330 domain-containing protein [Sandaracinaceae bacterium]